MGCLIHQHLLSVQHSGTPASLLPPKVNNCKTLWKMASNNTPHMGNGGAALRRTHPKRSSCRTVVCGIGDFLGADLLRFDLGKWVADVEKYGSIAIYPPAEGGYEGRYATRLKAEGYHFLNLTARGLGDLEAYLTKVHGVRPVLHLTIFFSALVSEIKAMAGGFRGFLLAHAGCSSSGVTVDRHNLLLLLLFLQPHLGKQAVAVYYFPPEVDYRLSLLPKGSKGLVLWLIEAQVLSKAELQYLTLLPSLRPRVRVIAECGTWRKFTWKPLSVVAGLPAFGDEQQAKQITKT